MLARLPPQSAPKPPQQPRLTRKYSKPVPPMPFDEILRLDRLNRMTAPPPRVPPKNSRNLQQSALPSPNPHYLAIPTAKNLGQKTTPTPAYHRYPLRSRPICSPNTSSFAPRYAAAAAHMISSELIKSTQQTDLLMNSVVDKDTGISMEYRALSRGVDKEVWIKSFANDLGRLAQGVGTRMPTGTNTIFFYFTR